MTQLSLNCSESYKIYSILAMNACIIRGCPIEIHIVVIFWCVESIPVKIINNFKADCTKNQNYQQISDRNH